MLYRPLLSFCAVGLLGLSPAVLQTAHAALGGDVTSITDEVTAMSGTDAVTVTQTYDIHRVSSAAGLQLTEYVDRSGRIFAVAWSGPAMPDLRALLGSHYAAFAAALAAQTPRAHKSLHVATPALVVENSGTTRSVAGRAFIPAALPAGLGSDNVR